MSSLKKIETARANGAKSRGPKTEEGKRRSSQNALKHGLYARDLVLTIEDQADFTALRDAYFAELQPQGVLELGLVEQMVMARWRLARLWRIETAMLESAMDRNEKQVQEDWTQPDNSLRLALAFDILAREDGALTQLNRQESRLSRQFERASRELRRLRATAPTGPQPPSDPPPAPVAEPTSAGEPPATGHEPPATGRLFSQNETLWRCPPTARMEIWAKPSFCGSNSIPHNTCGMSHLRLISGRTQQLTDWRG